MCHIDYCLSICGHNTKENIHKIQRLQNRAACIISNDFDYDQTGITVVKQLGLLTVLVFHISSIERRDYCILITVFKCMNDLAPHYLSDSFVYVSDVHNHVTRQTNIGDLYVSNATTSYMQKSLQYSSSLLWNRLPQHIRNGTNLNIFKCLCKSLLLSQPDSN